MRRNRELAGALPEGDRRTVVTTEPRANRAPAQPASGEEGASIGDTEERAANWCLIDNLNVTSRLGLTVHAQLQAQIRYAVATGHLRPRDALPSINELAGRLGINRNTVHQVYRRLQEIGLVEVVHGKGVFVSSGSGSSPSVSSGLSRLLQRTYLDALALGVSPLTFSHYLQAQAQTFGARFPFVAFLECNRYQATEFAREIGDRWETNVRPVLVSAVARSLASLPSSCRLVLTTYFHYPEVRQMLASRDLLIRPVIVDVLSSLKEILEQLPCGSSVGVIYRFEGVHEVERLMESEAGMRHLDMSRYPFRDRDHRGLKRFLERVDILICPDTARDAVARTQPNPSPRIIEWKARLDLASLDALQHSIPFLRRW